MTAFPFEGGDGGLRKPDVFHNRVLSNSLLGEEMGQEKSFQIPFAEVPPVPGLSATDPSFAHHMSDVFYEPPSSSWPGPEQGAKQSLRAAVCGVLGHDLPQAPGEALSPSSCGCLQALVFLHTLFIPCRQRHPHSPLLVLPGSTHGV